MADENCDASKIVTAFFLNTCRLPSWPNHRDVQAAACRAVTAGSHPPDDEEAELIPLITESVAEFCIEPMLPHVVDIDVMFHRNTELAIPEGHPPPTQLPAEFHNYVQVFEIIDSHAPGYVYLLLRYLLTQCSGERDEGEHNSVKYEYKLCYLLGHATQGNIHGPAVLTDNRHTPSWMSIDNVACVRCLSWPTQAADWRTRHRNYGWPDSATVDRVVSNGCDVVRVAHRQCRQHEWMGKLQCRLSFSRAEIVLINSWMPVQQISYHLLRVYVKTERLTESADNFGACTLSNYHIKTLILWACELKPRSWWTEKLNIVRICVELLHTLSAWLTDTRCPHYFISNCNLLDNSFSAESVSSKLTSMDEEYLSTWLIHNYVYPCAQLCPNYILRLFNDVSTSVKLKNAILAVVHWRLNTSLLDSWRTFTWSEYVISHAVSRYSLVARSCDCWMSELRKTGKHLFFYFSAVAMLHVAHKVLKNYLSNKLQDIFLTVLGRNFIRSQCHSVFSWCTTELNTSELVELLQKSAVEQLTTYRQLEARDFGSVATIATTDFEALYAYKHGNYHRCLQLSTRNVHKLLFARRMPSVLIHPEFIQLMDDDIVSLTALTLIVNPKCRRTCTTSCITQVTLSLYLMTQCQLKLHHSVTSLALTLRYIRVAHRDHPRWCILDHMTLKLIKRKVQLTIYTRTDVCGVDILLFSLSCNGANKLRQYLQGHVKR